MTKNAMVCPLCRQEADKLHEVDAIGAEPGDPTFRVCAECFVDIAKERERLDAPNANPHARSTTT